MSDWLSEFRKDVENVQSGNIVWGFQMFSLEQSLVEGHRRGSSLTDIKSWYSTGSDLSLLGEGATTGLIDRAGIPGSVVY